MALSSRGKVALTLPSPNELKGELRSAIKSKVPSEETLVKELCYKIEKKERIFWFTQQNGNWKVISDVEVPEGVFF
jgi:hypothetical protein